MPRGNEGVPSWMTVLKDDPNAEDVFGRLKRIGKQVSDSWFGDLVTVAAASAAGEGAVYVVTRNLSPERAAAARTLTGPMNSMIQDVTNKVINQWRGKNPPTDEQLRKLAEEDLRKKEQVRQLMRTYRVPGY
jgi:hypothetical protein